MGGIKEKKHLIVVVGPTAVGKTDLCVRLAKFYKTDIISADSRQFYREMHIGTAKPSAEEQQGVVHHFVDSHSITEDVSAGAFEAEVLKLLERLYQKTNVVIMTGGSGLYVRAVCEGMDAMPETDLTVRDRLVAMLASDGLPALQKQLQQLDPVYYQQVDKSNPQRVIRALEVSISSGKPYSYFRTSAKQERPYNIVKLGLNRDRQELYTRIDQRMDQMLQQGLLQEAQELYPYRNHNALQTVGYKEIYEYLQGKYDWEEALRLLKRNSRRYAKRQITWFTKYADYTWFQPTEWEEILQFLNERMRE